jgi:hypothetical protein
MNHFFGRCALGASFGFTMLSVGISGCAAHSSSTAAVPQLGLIGPPVPVQLVATHEGSLVVLTDYIPVPAIDLDTHQRADYRILRSDGTVFRRVSNAGSPAKVALPEGNYLIDAAVAPYGAMRIPVRVAADRTTEICLTGELDDAFKRVPADAVIKLPDGRVVGWRSQ